MYYNISSDEKTCILCIINIHRYTDILLIIQQKNIDENIKKLGLFEFVHHNFKNNILWFTSYIKS